MKGRQPKPDRPVKVCISLPEPMINKLRLILLDPTRNRTRYGSVSGLAEKLLRDWLEQREGLMERKEMNDVDKTGLDEVPPPRG